MSGNSKASLLNNVQEDNSMGTGISKKTCTDPYNTNPSNNNNNESCNKNSNNCNIQQEWDYESVSPNGPRHWAQSCAKQQSPINLQLSQLKQINVYSAGDPLNFINYDKPLDGILRNTGRHVQFIPKSTLNCPEISGGNLDQSYKFIQYHYHWAQKDHEGSEHRIGCLCYAGELHLVHQGISDPTKLAVLAVFLHVVDEPDTDPDDHPDPESLYGEIGKALKAEENHFHGVQESNAEVNLDSQLLDDKLPKNRHVFVRYDGSLTTPPCSENVYWTVFVDPVLISRKQLTELRTIIGSKGCQIQKNYRPIQRLNGRNVYLAI